ncbi:PREDICTED: uncharacterized protein LOC105313002 [Amphimedon queenslandica]|uniref:Uncharacterized protein n=1 Tax=Amphimedon queenslandica TaxID=400682 RepID=A0A1X7UNQ4_AMPQE|nr:PREDICTED: uncharacterized protein LOC105313002 [Amphimedon queenslandica]|eukprot:XP_011404394.1 PREDICTED: uncharacterized protein LOC105313002 [Amphimedon queenslandica]
MSKLTRVLAEYLYESNELLPEEQKGCKRGSKRFKDQLLIDRTLLRDCKKRHANLSLVCIDYKKAYDMVPNSWILECLDIMGCAKNARNLFEKSMSQWKCELTAGGTVLGEVPNNRGIFQGDSLSLLMFVVCLIPLTMVLRKVKAGMRRVGK